MLMLKSFFKNINTYYFLFLVFITLTIVTTLKFKNFNKNDSFLKIKKKKKNGIISIIKEFNILKNTNLKYNIVPLKLGNFLINFELALLMLIIVALFFSFLLSILLDINIFLVSTLTLIISSILFLRFIDNEYLNRQRVFESRLPKIGLISKQFIALNKPLDDIISSLAINDDYIIKDEFHKIKINYISTNDIKEALNSIKIRYPNSILRSLIFLFNIYYENRRDISKEIDNLIREIDAIERTKKKIEIEFAKQDKTLLNLFLISFCFVGVFTYFNESFKDFYTSKRGIKILFFIIFYEILGLVLINYFKSAILKSKKIRRSK